MNLDWIVPFQQTLERLNDQCQMLIQVYPTTEEMDRQCLEIVVKNLAHVMEWAQRLVPDETVWRWIDASTVFHENIAWLSAMASSCDVLLMLIAERGGTDDSITTLIKALSDETHSAIRTLQKITREDKGIWLSPATVLQPASPWAVVSVVLTVMSREIATPISWPDDISDWPSAAYHPAHTYHLLCLVSFSLHRPLGKRMTLTLGRTSTHFEMKLTVQGLHLTSMFWDGLMAVLMNDSEEATLEHLYEMGGEIEPLAWDEGQGEGVIVRLPWKTS